MANHSEQWMELEQQLSQSHTGLRIEFYEKTKDSDVDTVYLYEIPLSIKPSFADKRLDLERWLSLHQFLESRRNIPFFGIDRVQVVDERESCPKTIVLDSYSFLDFIRYYLVSPFNEHKDAAISFYSKQREGMVLNIMPYWVCDASVQAMRVSKSYNLMFGAGCVSLSILLGSPFTLLLGLALPALRALDGDKYVRCEDGIKAWEYEHGIIMQHLKHYCLLNAVNTKE